MLFSKQIENFLCRKRIHKNKHKYTLSGEDFLLVETFSLIFFFRCRQSLIINLKPFKQTFSKIHNFVVPDVDISDSFK